ncbi:Phosphatidylinositol 4,5-bisphosphate 5-phosphatase [Komagataella phaffii CBS 7435]|nr:Phosphatidylinositol 4,5-bisphosphate 5-phosphatase [Komagataella phaffii CBS 7435]CCA36402.1 Phosphatidylinositol 4,5-bisphosphate 5-phosphatase [Komagataella phaffii CBS 7435]
MRIHLLTFNCGKNEFRDNTALEELSKSVENSLPDDPPEIVAIAFQELTSIRTSFDYNLVHEILLDVNDAIVQRVSEHYQVTYHTLGLTHNGAITLSLLVLRPSRFYNIRTSYLPRGVAFSSLKGGVGIRVAYKSQVINNDDENDKELTFVSCHLNANEGEVNFNRRNQDLNKILSEMDFSDQYSVLKPDSHIFVLGDLNYRCSKVGEVENVSEIDELEKVKGDLDFTEAPIHFAQTYKYIIGTQDTFRTNRIPSWCDRILFLNYQEDLQPEYNSLPELTISDHKPVYLTITVPNTVPFIIYRKPTYYGSLVKTVSKATDTMFRFSMIKKTYLFLLTLAGLYYVTYG